MVGIWISVVVQCPQIRPEDPSNIPSLSAVDVLHSPQSVCENDDAPANIFSILVTLDTFHIKMSLVNDDAEANMPYALVTLDTSHLERSPVNYDA